MSRNTRIVAFHAQGGDRVAYVVSRTGGRSAATIDLSAPTAPAVARYLEREGLELRYRVYTHAIDDTWHAATDPFSQLVADLGLDDLNDGVAADRAHHALIQGVAEPVGPVKPWAPDHGPALVLVKVGRALYELDPDSTVQVRWPDRGSGFALTGSSLVIDLDGIEVVVLPLSGTLRRVAVRVGGTVFTGAARLAGSQIPDMLERLIEELDPSVVLAPGRYDPEAGHETVGLIQQHMLVWSAIEDSGPTTPAPPERPRTPAPAPARSAGPPPLLVGRAGKHGEVFVRPAVAWAHLTELAAFDVSTSPPNVIIGGGRYVPPSELAAELNAAGVGRPVLLSSDDESAVDTAVLVAVEIGVRPIYRIEGGMAAWRAESLPLGYCAPTARTGGSRWRE